MISLEDSSFAVSTTSTETAEIDITTLVETYSRLLFRVAHSLLRSSSEAEDVVQDVFVRVLEHRSTLPAVRDLRVWLIRIAWNLALDRCRRIRPDQMDHSFAANLTAASRGADQVLGVTQQVQAVLAEIDRLPRAERQVLLLAALEELQTGEIAQIMARSESAVRALLFRARTNLRTRLEKGGLA